MSSSRATSSVFHAYDIRGLSPQEIDEVFARRLARSLVRTLHPHSVLIGRDMRLTSRLLEDAMIEELRRCGVDVIRIGLCSTPLFYASVGLRHDTGKPVDVGVMVTASHNPGKYNGFKFVRGDVSPIGHGSGMEEIEASFLNDEEVRSSERPGNVAEDSHAIAQYMDRIFAVAQLPDVMPRWKIAIDAGNGMGGHVLPEVLRRCPWIEAVTLYFEPDGNFPNHEANPLKRETLATLSDTVVREKCVFGVAFDGDADRIGLVDETGAPIPGDLVTALLATHVVSEHPGANVLYDLRSSWAVPEAILAAGGNPEMCRVGHAFIKRQMRERGAVFAGEVSMHYYFRDMWNAESGDLVFLRLCAILAKTRMSVSDLWRPLQRYVHSGEINFTVTEKEAVLSRLRATYARQATSVSELDGIRMEFRHPSDASQDWWFNIRASNTEPLLRLNLETRTLELTRAKVQELTALIEQD